MKKIKVGNLLRYKKRLFRSNWKPTQITLFWHGSFILQNLSTSSTPTFVKCRKDSTLILFGQQIKSIPKQPVLPSGYESDQLLAIGLIQETKSTTTSIVFYWFLTESIHELFDWIFAFRSSLISLNDNDIKEEERDQDEQLALGILMAGTAYYNIEACDTFDPSLHVAPDFNDCSFAQDFSICSGI